MFKHWFCVVVTNPSALLSPSFTNEKGRSQLLFCDSMFEARDFIVMGLRRYLQMELTNKKKIVVKVDENVLPSYQILVFFTLFSSLDRQTLTIADCTCSPTSNNFC